MRVFISEFVCGGGWPGELPESLAREGEAMLRAVVEDLSQLDDVRVTTTWDSRLGPAPFNGVQVIPIEYSEIELPVFRELAGICDATLIIAPEIDGILSMRAAIALQAGARLLGPSVEAIDLCSDKRRLAEHWEQHGISTISTHEFGQETPDRFPIVVKPRDGAGSQGVRLIASRAEWDLLRSEDRDRSKLLWQPYVPGRAVSCALFVNPAWPEPIALLPAEQWLSSDGHFSYLGGRIPARSVDAASVQRAALGACSVVEGLRGYVGVDLIIREADTSVIAVEINPRLTTSYVGYRQLALDNLASYFCEESMPHAPRWRSGEVVVDPRSSGFAS